MPHTLLRTNNTIKETGMAAKNTSHNSLSSAQNRTINTSSATVHTPIMDSEVTTSVRYGTRTGFPSHASCGEIKKSTVTGQETFFPRELVCERIELIKKQKDDVSLDELSDHFSSESKKKATLVIDTAFGKKVFYLSDIRSILLEDNEGNKKDITDEVIGGTK